MTLSEILASRITASFSGFDKELLVNLLWWDAQNPGENLEVPRVSREFIVRHPEGVHKSGYTKFMSMQGASTGKVITAKVVIPHDRLVDALVSGALGFEYSEDSRTGQRKYKTQQTQGPLELVLHVPSELADLPAVYVEGGSAFVNPPWQGPTTVGELFTASSPWPVEPLQEVSDTAGKPLNVYEQLFYLFTNRRIPTASSPAKLLPPNAVLWGGMDAGGIEEFGTRSKFSYNVGTHDEPIMSELYNTYVGSHPENGSFVISAPYVQVIYAADGTVDTVNDQDAEEFVWGTAPGDHLFYSADMPGTELSGVFIDQWGRKYVLSFHPLKG